MSTQTMQVPQNLTGTSGVKRVGAALLVVGALAAGVVIGRSTAPTAQVREGIRPATALSDVGARSIGDLARNRYNRAMNRIDLGTSTSGFGAGSDGWVSHVERYRAANQQLPQQI